MALKLGHAVILNAMSEFVDADIAPTIAIDFKLQEVFLAARGQQPAQAARALVDGLLAVEWFATQVAVLEQVRSNLIAADDVQFGAGVVQAISHVGQMFEHHC